MPAPDVGIGARACARTSGTRRRRRCRPQYRRSWSLDLLEHLGVGEEARRHLCKLHALRDERRRIGSTDLAPFPSDVRILFEGQQAARKVWRCTRTAAGSGGNEVAPPASRSSAPRVVFILLARQLVRMRVADRLPETERREPAPAFSTDIRCWRTGLASGSSNGSWWTSLSASYLQPDRLPPHARPLDDAAATARNGSPWRVRSWRGAGEGGSEGGHRRAAETHLLDLAQDVAQGARVPPSLRRACCA